MNQKANRIIKERFLKAGIDHCEYPGCLAYDWLTIAHRHKRRHYRTIEELTDLNQVLLLCMHHHEETEYDRNKTEELFTRIRGKDILKVQRKP